MEKIVIVGGKQLKGQIRVSGAKNSALGIIPACILVGKKCVIENVPLINDVYLILEIMTEIGADVQFYKNKNTLEIDCSKANIRDLSSNLVNRIRASSYFLGALIGRFNEVSIGFPGGCNFGIRPLDQHVKGLEALGAKVNIERGNVNAKAKTLKGATIYLDVISVGATINVMLAAVKAIGETVIENAAKEPHVVDVANFLNSMGAKIAGAGTDVIKINGVTNLFGGTYKIIPDQVEAGTFLIAGAIPGNDIVVNDIIPKHLEAVIAKLIELGVKIERNDSSIHVKSERINGINVRTLPYPGFPTDLQPQMLTLLTKANGTSIINEEVWNNRFNYVDELRKMGANIQVDGKVAVVRGVKNITGASVRATDLRAGAALIIAGLMAEGISEIHNLEHLDRGYENIVKKLKSIGAQIIRKEATKKGKISCYGN